MGMGEVWLIRENDRVLRWNWDGTNSLVCSNAELRPSVFSSTRDRLRDLLSHGCRGGRCRLSRRIPSALLHSRITAFPMNHAAERRSQPAFLTTALLQHRICPCLPRRTRSAFSTYRSGTPVMASVSLLVSIGISGVSSRPPVRKAG